MVGFDGFHYAWKSKFEPHNLVGRRHLKSILVDGWCGLGWVRSLGDFDGLDAHGFQFLKPGANPASHIQTRKHTKNI